MIVMFSRIVRLLRGLGFDVEAKCRREREDGKEYVVHEVFGRKQYRQYTIVINMLEINGNVEYVKFEVLELPTVKVYAESAKLEAVKKAYNKIIETIDEVMRRKENSATILQQLKRLGFEVYEGTGYAEAVFRKTGLDCVRIVLNFEPRYKHTLFIQMTVNNDVKLIEVARKAINIIKLK